MTKRVRMLFLFFVLIAFGIVSFVLRGTTPTIIICPKPAMFDDKLQISIVDLPANARVTLKTSCENYDGNLWCAQAVFQANKKGVVKVAKQSPISGSYQGVEPMGLIWSLAPVDEKAAKNGNLKLAEVTLSVFSQEKLLAQATIARGVPYGKQERKDIREQGIVGTLFYPKDVQPAPGVIVIPGSGGGIPEDMASLLACYGYTVLALAYVGEKGLPEKESMIPLEYFHTAMQWFKKQPQVLGGKIATLGWSRGGEIVLLMASHFPGDMDAAIAISTPSMAYSDLTIDAQPVWTLHGEVLPYMGRRDFVNIRQAEREGRIPLHKGTFEDPYHSELFFLCDMEKMPKDAQAAAIPVENIRCPLLILSGENDNLWPTAVYGKLIMDRLSEHKSKISRKLIVYPNAGHNLFALPYHPALIQDKPFETGSTWYRPGGTPAGNAAAQEGAWREIRAFLEKVLR